MRKIWKTWTAVFMIGCILAVSGCGSGDRGAADKESKEYSSVAQTEENLKKEKEPEEEEPTEKQPEKTEYERVLLKTKEKKKAGKKQYLSKISSIDVDTMGGGIAYSLLKEDDIYCIMFDINTDDPFFVQIEEDGNIRRADPLILGKWESPVALGIGQGGTFQLLVQREEQWGEETEDRYAYIAEINEKGELSKKIELQISEKPGYEEAEWHLWRFGEDGNIYVVFYEKETNINKTEGKEILCFSGETGELLQSRPLVHDYANSLFIAENGDIAVLDKDWDTHKVYVYVYTKEQFFGDAEEQKLPKLYQLFDQDNYGISWDSELFPCRNGECDFYIKNRWGLYTWTIGEHTIQKTLDDWFAYDLTGDAVFILFSKQDGSFFCIGVTPMSEDLVLETAVLKPKTKKDVQEKKREVISIKRTCVSMEQEERIILFNRGQDKVRISLLEGKSESKKDKKAVKEVMKRVRAWEKSEHILYE